MPALLRPSAAPPATGLPTELAARLLYLGPEAMVLDKPAGLPVRPAMQGRSILPLLRSGRGAVDWPQAVVMLIGGTIGGYGGAAYARRLEPSLVRRIVIVVAVAMTVYFFIRAL